MSDTSTGTVTEQRLSTHIAAISFSNPGKLNSFSVPMWQQLTQIMCELGKVNSGVRCIIFSGADKKSFAAGSDITEFKSNRSNVEQARVYGKVVSDALNALESCHVPMIAKINGSGKYFSTNFTEPDVNLLNNFFISLFFLVNSGFLYFFLLQKTTTIF